LVIRRLQAQEATKRQETIMAFTRSPALTEQTKPGNPSYFRFKEAGPESDEVLDADGNRRYSAVAFAVAKMMRDGEVKQRTTFKIDQMTVTEWIGINMKAFPLPFYASFGLMTAPPLGRRCRTCGKIPGREVCAFQGINGKPGDSLAGCDYAFCDDKGKHARKVCPTLNHRYSSCLYRGHRADSKRCGQFNANLAIFEYQAGHGLVTANRTQDWGAAKGFWPVIRLAQLHHIAAHGGNARLLTLNRNDVRKLLKEGDDLHDTWVGAKPLSTQIATEEAFSKTRYNKYLSEANAHHYAAGIEHTSRLRRPPQRVGQVQGRRIAAVGGNLQNCIYKRVTTKQTRHGKPNLLRRPT
jgi:hypothetical protein